MNRRRLIPYALIAPAMLYLAAFFAYPMFEGLSLAIYDDEAVLPLLADPDLEAPESERLAQGTPVAVLGQQGNLLADDTATDLLTEQWFSLEGQSIDGSTITGWAPETRVRVRSEADDGTPLGGTIRPRLAEGAEPTTELVAEPNERAAVVGLIEERTTVSIVDTATLEVWFLVRSTGDPSAAEGWAPSRFIQVDADGEQGRVSRGSAGEFTGRFVEKMLNDRFFGPAWRTTLLLMVLIIPAQFVLAMIMALIIHARIRFSSGFLYVFSLPMGMSDLAVGILFFSIFTGSGLLNSVLDGLGLIDGPQTFLSAQTRHWIIIAIVLAELWRATSIVMVILVSGLQAIPDETLEAAELFGASYWQRVRHIMLPLLRPSIQVALILRTILAFQVFAVVIALGGGDVVTVLANETFRQYFVFRNNNVASAYALFLLLLSIASAVFYLRAVRAETAVDRT
ncbi:MAG: ABC transporter permease subunit [Acidimicrobiales bacterium]